MIRRKLPPTLIVYSPKSTYKGCVKQRDHLKKCLEKDYNMGWVEGSDWNFKYFVNEQFYTNYYQIVKHYQKYGRGWDDGKYGIKSIKKLG